MLRSLFCLGLTMPQDPKSIDVGMPALPPNPLQRNALLEQILMSRYTNVPRNQITGLPFFPTPGPWPIQPDYDNPSDEYLSMHTQGPLTNAAQDAMAIRQQLDATQRRAGKRQDATTRANDADRKRPIKLGKK